MFFYNIFVRIFLLYKKILVYIHICVCVWTLNKYFLINYDIYENRLIMNYDIINVIN